MLKERLQTVGMSKKTFHNFLREWREHRGLTQEQLSELVGCSKASIGHWENHERRLTDKWLPSLSKALKTTSGYILEHSPHDIPTDVFDVWSEIPDGLRPHALEILKTFSKTGT